MDQEWFIGGALQRKQPVHLFDHVRHFLGGIDGGHVRKPRVRIRTDRVDGFFLDWIWHVISFAIVRIHTRHGASRRPLFRRN